MQEARPEVLINYKQKTCRFGQVGGEGGGWINSQTGNFDYDSEIGGATHQLFYGRFLPPALKFLPPACNFIQKITRYFLNRSRPSTGSFVRRHFGTLL